MHYDSLDKTYIVSIVYLIAIDIMNCFIAFIYVTFDAYLANKKTGNLRIL